MIYKSSGHNRSSGHRHDSRAPFPLTYQSSLSITLGYQHQRAYPELLDHSWRRVLPAHAVIVHDDGEPLVIRPQVADQHVPHVDASAHTQDKIQ
jgi:hypothetical protein